VLTKTDYKKVRDIVFLKDVMLLSLSAFGGPEMHISLFIKQLVHQKKYISESEVLELNSLCQILPGPSSTQTLTAIAFKIGGPRLAFLALMIWILPATILMTLFVVSTNFVNPHIFKFIGPMAIGFVVMAALQMTKLLQKNTKTIALAIISATAAVFFHSPFLFPIVLILGGVISSYWDRAEQATAQKVGFTIRWANLTLMFLILITVAVVGLYTKTTMPHWSQPIRLFENTYRMGIMVFGGGNVLYTMILTEFVEFKAKHYLTIQEFNTGIGLLQAVPGPTFSIATYANGMAMKNLGYGIAGQVLGCGVGTIAIFLPGTLLIFFVYPIWNRIKQIPVIYRSLKGIIAVSIGLVWAAAILMIIPYLKNQWLTNADQWLSFAVFILTILYLKWIKQPAVFLVLAVVLAGYLMLLMNA